RGEAAARQDQGEGDRRRRAARVDPHRTEWYGRTILGVPGGTLTRGRLADHPVWRNALGSAELVGRLVQPVIVSDAVEDRERVEGAGGLMRLSITEAVRDARAAAAAGIAGLLVFGASDGKDETAFSAGH